MLLTHCISNNFSVQNFFRKIRPLFPCFIQHIKISIIVHNVNNFLSIHVRDFILLDFCVFYLIHYLHSKWQAIQNFLTINSVSPQGQYNTNHKGNVHNLKQTRFTLQRSRPTPQNITTKYFTKNPVPIDIKAYPMLIILKIAIVNKSGWTV